MNRVNAIDLHGLDRMVSLVSGPWCRDRKIPRMNGCTFFTDTELFGFESLVAQVFIQEVGIDFLESENLRLAWFKMMFPSALQNASLDWGFDFLADWNKVLSESWEMINRHFYFCHSSTDPQTTTHWQHLNAVQPPEFWLNRPWVWLWETGRLEIWKAPRVILMFSKAWKPLLYR